jgi:hypothetical protein
MPHLAKHISSSFDIALYALKNDVLMMSSLMARLFELYSKVVDEEIKKGASFQ